MANWAVAAGHDLTADAAAGVLDNGGTAADAAVAAAAMSFVAEPVLAGLLGGGFALVRRPDGGTAALDMFVETPSAKRPESEADLREIHADFGTTTQSFAIGAGTVAVPMLAPGLAELHARHGRMPFAELMAPAAEASRKGVEVDAFRARLASIIAPILSASPEALQLHGDGERLATPGERLVNTAFADVLEVFGAEGPRFVQEGEVGAGLAELCRSGGHLSRRDLRRAEPRWRRPLIATRGDVRIAMNPPPSLGGALVGLTLALAPHRPSMAELAQVFRTVARARETAGDAAPATHFTEPAVATDLAGVLAREGMRPLSVRGTTHISVVDGAGLGVALTLSNGEGCGLVVPGSGIMPNNMLGELDLVPGGPMEWRPGERLASMMAPMAAEWPDGRVAMLGSGGSNRIRTALSAVLIGLVDHGRDPERAVADPRLHVEGGREAQLDYEEPGLPEGERAGLREAFPEARGWDEPSMFFGGVHIAARDRAGGVAAAGDPRRAGAVRMG